MFYYSLIYPYFYHCNVVWASAYKSNLRRLVIVQKRIIRIINNSHFNAHADPISIICFNWAYLWILAKILSYLQGLITISLKAMNEWMNEWIPSIPLLQYKKFPGLPSTVLSYKREEVLALFSRGLSFLIHLTTRSSTRNPSPLLRKNWRLNYWVSMKNS